MSVDYKLHLFLDGKYRLSIPISKGTAEMVGALSGKQFKEGYVWTTVTSDVGVNPISVESAVDYFFINKQDEITKSNE